ncbi:MAG: hypothetical protein QOG04_1152 [Actinomycetota bacterium]|nr:hypothetical protein [Actinomycetota bacterium]
MDTARDLFEHELRDIYDAEHKLERALESMASKVTNTELANGFKEHQSQTKGHIERLDKVFGIIDRAPRREACDGINGLISEFSGFVKDESPSDPVLNLFATAAAIKTEFYEINAYKSLIKLADHLGLSEAAELFEQNLKEEEETAQQLDALSDKLGQEVPVG